MELKGKKVNVLGDSITEGVGASCIEKAFPSVMKELGEFEVVRNYGISGTRVARQIIAPGEEVTSFDHDYCERYVDMDDDADIIVVFGGTNDFGHGNAEFGTLENTTPDTFCGAVDYLMRGLIEKYPTSEIVFLTPLHRSEEDNVNSHGYVLSDYREVILEAAEKYSIPVLDLYGMGGIQPRIKAQLDAFMPDGLHPNDAGHYKVARRICEFLKTL